MWKGRIKMLKIGDFSKLAQISIRMLRHYDELGLLTPEQVDGFTGYRYYSEAQLPTAVRIMALKDMGFRLAAIPEILRRYDEPEALSAFLAEKRAQLRAEADETAYRLKLLETAMQRLRKEDGMMQYDVALKQMPERYVASLRMVIPAYDQEQILWNIMRQETAHLHLKMADPRYSLAVYHDEGYKERDVDVEIQIAVTGSYPDTEHVRFQTVPPVQIACATYQGSYKKITEANEAVACWVRDNGYEFDGIAFSIYHVSPAETQNPEELVTEVCYPVKKKNAESTR